MYDDEIMTEQSVLVLLKHQLKWGFICKSVFYFLKINKMFVSVSERSTQL